LQLNACALSGANSIEYEVVFPAANVTGVVPEASLNSGQEEVIELIVTLDVPVFLTVMLFEVDCIPI